MVTERCPNPNCRRPRLTHGSRCVYCQTPFDPLDEQVPSWKCEAPPPVPGKQSPAMPSAVAGEVSPRQEQPGDSGDSVTIRDESTDRNELVIKQK